MLITFVWGELVFCFSHQNSEDCVKLLWLWAWLIWLSCLYRRAVDLTILFISTLRLCSCVSLIPFIWEMRSWALFMYLLWAADVLMACCLVCTKMAFLINSAVVVVTLSVRGWSVVVMSLHTFYSRSGTFCRHHLVSLVVKASMSRGEDPRFESYLRWDFSGVESYLWLKNWHSSTLPGTWHYRVNAGTGWPSVSILWLGEMESSVCNFYQCGST